VNEMSRGGVLDKNAERALVIGQVDVVAFRRKAV